MSSASSEAPDEVSSEAPDEAGGADQPWDERFLEILNNKDKRRTSGFVVAVRGTTSLATVQDLCYDRSRQNWNVCLSGRYRLREPSLGTLLTAFVSDLVAGQQAAAADTLKTSASSGAAQSSGDAQQSAGGFFQPPATAKQDPSAATHTAGRGDQPTIGDLREDPASGGAGWQQLHTYPRLMALAAATTGRAAGTLPPSWLRTLFEVLEDVLGGGQRVVLFAELERSDGYAWDLDELLRLPLPERFGIVVTTPANSLGWQVGHDGLVVTGSRRPGRGWVELLDVPATSTPGLVADYTDVPFTGDQLAEVDTLDRRWYAAALANLVLLPDTGPMTIGVHARWGAGKSSFMRFVRWELLRGALAEGSDELAELKEAEEHLEEVTAVLHDPAVLGDVDADPEVPRYAQVAARVDAARRLLTAAKAERGRALDRLERAAADTVLCVRFNAWLYEGATQIWAGLTHEITRAMEDSLPWWRRMATRVRYAVHAHGAGFWVGAAFGVAAAALLAGLALVLGFGASGSALAGSLPAGLEVVARLLPTGSVLAVGLLLAWRLSRGFVPVSGRIAQYLRQPDYREHMGYQHQVRRDIEFLKARLRRGAREPRVVVFIDDLDRCSDERVLETLQAINLLLTESGCYVFLGIDTEMIIKAIERRYRADADADADPGTSDTEHRARSYLDKILQLNIPLREPDAPRSFSFLAGFFSPQARQEHQRRGTTATPEADEDEWFEPVDQPGELAWDRALVAGPPVQDYQVRLVEDTADELAAFEALSEYLPDNPRELKRLVNVHRLIRLLARNSGWRPGAAERQLIVGWLLFCFARPVAAARVVAAARAGEDRTAVVSDEELRPFLVTEAATLTAAHLAPGAPLGEAWEISALFRQ